MKTKGFTVWFTGLPSSGKSTLAQLLKGELGSRGFHVEVLDGDEVRKRLSKGLGFSKEDRDDNIRRIAFVAGAITRSGGVAVTCAISPYRAIRDEARQEIGAFVEVFVDCPLEECMRRDPKGLYKRALAGEIPNFTGISDPYEPPLHAEVVVNTLQQTPEESVHEILTALRRLGYVSDKEVAFSQVSLPTYLVASAKKLMGAQFVSVDAYLAYLVSSALEATTPEPEYTPEERENILSKLRSMGYID